MTLFKKQLDPQTTETMATEVKSPQVIDLGIFNIIPEGEITLDGSDFGNKMREATQIDLIEPQFEKFEIKIPAGILSMTQSFLDGFLKNVVIKLEEKNFNDKFSFTTGGDYDPKNDLKRGIERIIEKHLSRAYEETNAPLV